MALVLGLCGAALNGQAQNCGCAEAGNCTTTIVGGTNGQACYDFTDALNNDLSDPDQGVCGVRVRFRHTRVPNLEFSLTSPSGQSVTLVGEVVSPSNAFTGATVFDIVFVPCAPDGVCDPDVFTNYTMPCQWDNAAVPLPWPGGPFTGSYYPNDGCLQDFNTGPVNGTWCLDITNDQSFNNFILFDFEVILCDQAGLFCCDAEAGSLAATDDLFACIGADTLLLDEMQPNFGSTPFDDLNYGYTYLVSENDQLIQEDSVPDLRSYVPGSYTVCGFAYLLEDSLTIPDPADGWTLTQIQDTLDSQNPPFCAELSSGCFEVLIGSPPAPVDLTETICEGEVYTVGPDDFTMSGDYSVTLQTDFGCDSIVNLDLTVFPVDTFELSESICQDACFAVGDSCYTQSGQYLTQLTATGSGCDSFVLLDLMVVSPVFTALSDTICLGESYTIGDSTYTTPGNYEIPFQSFVGCDSTVDLNLTVLSVTAAAAIPDTLTCAENSVQLDGSASDGEVFVWSTSNGNLDGPTNQPTANATAPGSYLLTVSRAACTDTVSVVVVENTTAPVANAGSTASFLCGTEELPLDGSASTGSGFVVEWTSTNGTVRPGTETDLVAVAETPGTYLLTLTDPQNSCQDTASVILSDERIEPDLSIAVPPVLTCQDTCVALSASSTVGGVTYAWSTTTGTIKSGADTAAPEVSSAGSYVLTLTDPLNNCTTIDSVEVTESADLPVLSFSVSDTLNCLILSSTVTATVANVGGNISLNWSPAPDSGQGTNEITVSEPGFYSLTVEDLDTGCRRTDSIEVISTTDFPFADAGIDRNLNCIIDTITLGGQGTSAGGQISYEWTALNGTVLSMGQTLTVTTSGQYILAVSDPENGCTNRDTVTVTENFDTPVADAGLPQTLTCSVGSVILDASGSTAGIPSQFLFYTWYEPGGTEIAMTDTVSVGTPGMYSVVVEQPVSGCRDTATVEVTAQDDVPIAVAGPDQALDCNTGQAILDGSAGSTTGSNIQYQWQPVAGIVSGQGTPIITVDEVGTYTLTVLDLDNNCQASDEVLAFVDTLACLPVADAGPDGLINCYSDCDTLDGSGSTTGSAYIFAWASFPGGTIKDSLFTLNPIVGAGTYVLAVTNLTFGITSFDTVTVVSDLMPPVAAAGPDRDLSCAALDTCFVLESGNSSQSPDLVYSWTTIDGNFCSDTSILFASVDAPGVYELTVFNPANGCSASDAMVIDQLGSLPNAQAGLDAQIACGENSVMLDGSASSFEPGATIVWTSNDGTILNGGGTLAPEVSVPDNSTAVFYLEISNPNACSDLDSVLVAGPSNCALTCDIVTPAPPITCDRDTVFLDATASSSGPDYTVAWTTSDGEICAGADSLVVAVCASGNYLLTITNTISGFSCTQSVFVGENLSTPGVAVDSPVQIDCTTPDTGLVLDAGGSSVGPNISYEWVGPAPGCLVEGDTTLTPTVQCAGNYELTVRNLTNGCTNTATVSVAVDTLAPQVDAGPDFTITCDTIEAAGSGSSGGDFSSNWTTNNGFILNGANGFTPSISVAGTYTLTITNDQNDCSASDSMVVTAVGNTLDCTAGPDQLYTCADTSFTLTGMVTMGGSGNFSYNWSTSDGNLTGPLTTNLSTANAPGTYQLLITDLNDGCTCLAETTITADTLAPTAEAGMNVFGNCTGDPVQLDGSGSTDSGVEYTWTGPATATITGADTPSPTVDQPGTYFLEVIGLVNACSAIDSVQVLPPPSAPTADAGPDKTLDCSTPILTLGDANAPPTVDYAWSTLGGNIIGPFSTSTISVNAPGAYILSVTDPSSNCSSVDTVQVFADLDTPVAVVSASSSAITCADPTIQLFGDASTPADSITYSWFAIAGGGILVPSDQSITTINTPGTYVLRVTHTESTCTDTAQIVVTGNIDPPSILGISADTITCEDTLAQIFLDTDTAFDFAWSAGALVDTLQNPMVATAGTYGVTVTDPANGCTDSTSIVVVENTTPPDLQLSTTGVISCAEPEVMIAANSSIADPIYDWLPDPGILETTSGLATVRSPGFYLIEVTDSANGCSTLDSIEVLAEELPIESVLTSTTPPPCFGETDGTLTIDSVLGGTPPFDYSLDGTGFSSNPVFDLLEPGVYTLYITDENGCNFEQSVTVESPQELLLELGPDREIDLGDSTSLQAQINLTDSFTLVWSPVPDTCSNCLTQTVSPQETTVYTATLQDSSGCTLTDRITVFVLTELPAYVPTGFSPNGDGNNDVFRPAFGPSVEWVEDLRIYDRWGNLVYRTGDFAPNDPARGWDGTYRGQVLNPAVFVWSMQVRLVTGEQVVRKGEVVLLR